MNWGKTMSHTFYLGMEGPEIERKFQKVRKYLMMTEPSIKRGSRAECYRWIINKIYNLVIEKENNDNGS